MKKPKLKDEVPERWKLTADLSERLTHIVCAELDNHPTMHLRILLGVLLCLDSILQTASTRSEWPEALKRLMQANRECIEQIKEYVNHRYYTAN